MATLNVAISAKALALLDGTLIGNFITEGAQEADGTYTITLGPGTNGRLISAAAQNPVLGGRFIALVARAQGQGQGVSPAGR